MAYEYDEILWKLNELWHILKINHVKLLMLTSFKALTKIAPFGKLYRVTCRSSDIMKIVKVAENGKNFECKSNRPH